MRRDDGALPTVVAIANLPVVLANGELLMPDGLDRDRGVIFKIPQEVRALVPRREACTKGAVRDALRFLCDEWLCDVKTDAIGKCTIVADALTLIERTLLPNRPCFVYTAGKAEAGKTTVFEMLVLAITGLKTAAAAWSPNADERRKALLAYFMAGVIYILWDNIENGAHIKCPHIEKSCTASYYSDRKLCVSEIVATSASTIHHFNGNNIKLIGDLASRSLEIRLLVDRPDPASREFKHNDPIEWTRSHRAEILAALYTVLLGNPMLDEPRDAACETRFKMWWRVVGSAVEHAARLSGYKDKNGEKVVVEFQKLFNKQRESDEDSSTLADALSLIGEWSNGRPFMAKELVEGGGEMIWELRELWFPKVVGVISAKSMGNQLAKHVDCPVVKGDEVLILRIRQKIKGTSEYWISVATPKPHKARP